MFFTPAPASNAAELVNYMKDHLQADYRVEMPPRQIEIADRSFTSFAYWWHGYIGTFWLPKSGAMPCKWC
jgi:hypothetical protein